MTTENTVFKFQDGYILLEDLEDWFSNGFITPEDRIRIFEGKRSASYQISALIQIYGEKFPFRRKPRVFEFDPLAAYSSSSSDTENEIKQTDVSVPSVSDPVISVVLHKRRRNRKRGSTKITAENVQMDQYIYYPLFNDNNEPENDRITGQDVIDEMKNLKNLFPVQRGYSKEFLKDLKFMKNQVSFLFCHLCNMKPPNLLIYLKHLFESDHIQKLSNLQISRSSFVYWRNLFVEFNQKNDVDYPLFNNKNEPENDRITGQEVIDEMENLKTIFPLENWCMEFSNYFSFMNNKDEHLCHLCNVSPPGRYRFFLHLFDKNHIETLSKCNISRESFKFWRGHFEKCKESNIQAAMPRIPLFVSNISEDKQKLEPSEVALLVNLFSKVPPDHFINNQYYLARFFRSNHLPKFCEVCRYNTPKAFYKYAKHIISELHLNSLTGISQKEFNFWVNILTIESTIQDEKPEKMVGILTTQNSPPIPLIDFKLDSTLLEVNKRHAKIEQLRTIYKSIDKNPLIGKPLPVKGMLENQNVACIACSKWGLDEMDSNDKIMDHIFSEQHVKYLIQYGFSEKALMLWKKWLEDLTNLKPKKGENLKKTVTSTSESPSQGPTKSSLPKAMSLGNNPRVPLLDRPPENTPTCIQKIFVASFRNMTELFQQYWKEAKNEKIVDWQCEYCGTQATPVKFTKELDAFNHIISQKHKEKMKFTALVGDLKYWKEWVQSSSAETEKSVKAPHPEVQKTPDVPVVPDVQKITVTPKVPANNPRVPGLDPDPSKGCQPRNSKSKKEIEKTLDECCKRLRIGGKTVEELAKAIRVSWKCAFCVDENTYLPIFMSNKLYAFHHICSPHHQRMAKGYLNVSDLEFWKSWVDMLDEKRIKLGHVTIEDVIKRPKNKPNRVLLLDAPDSQKNLLGRKEYESKYNFIREELKSLEWIHHTNFKKDRVCYHCPGNPHMKTLWQTVEHIFDGKHDKNIMQLANKTDFNYYEKMIRSLKQETLKYSTKKTPVSVVNPIQTTSTGPSTSDSSHIPTLVLPKKSVECKLPLFVSWVYYSYGDFGTLCIGPTDSQIVRVWAAEHQYSEMKTPYFKEPTHCGFCEMDMTKWSILEVTQHVFSLEHLHNFIEKYTYFNKECFEYWISELRRITPDKTPIPVGLQLGGIERIRFDYSMQSFTGFSEDQLTQIANLDSEMISLMKHEELLAKYGGCAYCKTWQFNSLQVIRHFTSENHFTKVRLHHPVKQADVDYIMSYVSNCQKSERLKFLMNHLTFNESPCSIM